MDKEERKTVHTSSEKTDFFNGNKAQAYGVGCPKG
jgi:hypothetical protein